MDPNAALAEIRADIEMLKGSIENGHPDEIVVEHLIERVEALDDWISKGGFLPHDWKAGL